MNIIIGTPKDLQPSTFDEKVFVSQPYYKIVLKNGLGFYILNSYKYFLFPKFYGMIRNDFWEIGFNFGGYIFEIMWNKHFKFE